MQFVSACPVSATTDYCLVDGRQELQPGVMACYSKLCSINLAQSMCYPHWKSGDKQMSATALRVVAGVDDEHSESLEADDVEDLPDLRPSYDLHGDPRTCRWFGGIVVDFALEGAIAPHLHPSMVRRITRSLDGRHPRYIYDGGTMYLTFRLLSLAERQVVSEFADSLEHWLGQEVTHRVFEHGPAEVSDSARDGSVIRIR
jgi:hypothetical protein